MFSPSKVRQQLTLVGKHCVPMHCQQEHSALQKKTKIDPFNGRMQYANSRRTMPALQALRGMPSRSGKGDLLPHSLAQNRGFSGLVAAALNKLIFFSRITFTLA